MRIVHVVTRSHRRGAETTALELAHELRAMGHDNRVVALVRAHDSGQIAALPPLVHATTLGPLTRARCAWRLRRVLAAERPDVVVGHGGTAMEVAAVAVGRRPGPALVWQRVQPLPDSAWRSWRRRWIERTASRADAAVAISRTFEDELRRLGFSRPVWRIPNARRARRFAHVDRSGAGTALRSELGVNDDVALVGFVGHLADVKRPRVAVDVIADLRDTGTRACLVVAGGGPLRQRLDRDVADRDLGDVVRLLGQRDDIEHILAAVDLLLVTSEIEGVPGVVIEAAMAGCPVVTFPVGDVAEVVEDGVTGVVVERADVRHMADAVRKLLDDPDTRQRMSNAARQRRDRMSIELAAERYVALFEQLTAGRFNATGNRAQRRAHRRRAAPRRRSGW